MVSEWDRNSVAAAGGTSCFDGLVMNSGYEWDMSYYPMKHAMTMDMVYRYGYSLSHLTCYHYLFIIMFFFFKIINGRFVVINDAY